MQVINWGVFGFTAISGASWLAVSLMVIPYPRLVAEAGINLTVVYGMTSVFTVLALVSATALWLLIRRHAWLWVGQTALALALMGALGWVVQWM